MVTWSSVVRMPGELRASTSREEQLQAQLNRKPAGSRCGSNAPQILSHSFHPIKLTNTELINSSKHTTALTNRH